MAGQIGFILGSLILFEFRQQIPIDFNGMFHASGEGFPRFSGVAIVFVAKELAGVVGQAGDLGEGRAFAAALDHGGVLLDEGGTPGFESAGFLDGAREAALEGTAVAGVVIEFGAVGAGFGQWVRFGAVKPWRRVF